MQEENILLCLKDRLFNLISFNDLFNSYILQSSVKKKEHNSKKYKEQLLLNKMIF